MLACVNMCVEVRGWHGYLPQLLSVLCVEAASLGLAAGLASQLLRGLSCLCLSAGVPAAYTHLVSVYACIGDPNSSSHTCAARAAPTISPAPNPTLSRHVHEEASGRQRQESTSSDLRPGTLIFLGLSFLPVKLKNGTKASTSSG